MIYGVNEMITEMVLRCLENQGSYDILMNGFSLQSTTTPRKANKCIESALHENIICSVGGFWFWCLNLLNVVLSLVFIGGVLEGQSRLTRPAWCCLTGASG